MITRVWAYLYSAVFGFFALIAILELVHPSSAAAFWLSIQPPIINSVVAMISGILMLGFWFMMLADFFNNRDVERPVIVGFALLFLSWFAILIYYWTVVHQRSRRYA